MAETERRIVLSSLDAGRLRLLEPERLVSEVIGCVHDVLSGDSDIAQKMNHPLEEGQIKLVSQGELEEVVARDRPIENSVLYNVLTEIGVDKEVIKKHYYFVESERSYLAGRYRDEQLLYLRQESFAFESDDTRDRAESVARLAIELIHNNLLMLPKAFPLENKSYWREVARCGLHVLFQNIVSEGSNLDQADVESALELAEEEIVDGTKTTFVAHGVKVSVLCGADTLDNAQFRMGTDFNSGTVLLIAENINKRVLSLLRSKLILPDSARLHLRYDRDFEKSRSILRKLGLATLRAVLDAYAESEIPLLYIGASPKKINNLEYPA